MDTVGKLGFIFGRKEKQKFTFLLIIMFIGALFETVGIGLIIPFINIILEPNIIFEQTTINYIYTRLGFNSSNSFLIASCFGLLSVYVFKNTYLSMLYWYQYKLIYNEFANFSIKMLNFYLQKPYFYHLHRNSAELLRIVNTDTINIFVLVITPLCTLISELMVIVCILALLFAVQPYVTMLTVLFITIAAMLFIGVFRTKLGILGKQQQYHAGQMIKAINQSLGGIKGIKAANKESYFVKEFSIQVKGYSSAASFVQSLNQLPRLFIETTVVVTVLIVIVSIFYSNDKGQMLPILGLFAMAAFRIMPSINRIIGSITTIKYYKPSLDTVYNDFMADPDISAANNDDPKKIDLVATTNNTEQSLKKSIELNNLWYRYPESTQWTLREISLSIPIGKAVGFIGPSGAGKTTLIDLILGLLSPSKGHLLADGEDVFEELSRWRQRIGYIPQDIYLSDDSIMRNVAFGVEDKLIDEDRVWDVLKAAQLDTFVADLPHNINTYIGERGVRLSGGQRQRIGIARALYHNPEILILDEATSSLDTATEKEIMIAINMLKGEKTLLIIAHRLSTIENCDLVYEVKEGMITACNMG